MSSEKLMRLLRERAALPESVELSYQRDGDGTGRAWWDRRHAELEAQGYSLDFETDSGAEWYTLRGIGDELRAALAEYDANAAAQPSQGGQGDARSFVIAAYRKDGKHSIADAMEDGSYFPPYVQRAVNAVESALAARQPVGAVPRGCDACRRTGIRQNDEGRNVFCPDCDLGAAYAGVHMAQEPVGEIVAGKEVYDGERWVPTITALLNGKGKVGDKLYSSPVAYVRDLLPQEVLSAISAVAVIANKESAHPVKKYIDAINAWLYAGLPAQTADSQPVGMTELGWVLKRATPEQVLQYLEDDPNMRALLSIHLSDTTRDDDEGDTAPPAQAVDLAENMLSVLIEEGVLARNGRVFQKLRAMIDSMAGGQ